MRNRVLSASAFVCLIALVLYSTACGDFFVSGSTLDHITLSPSAVYLSTANAANPESKQLAASGVNVDGTASDVTGSATWNTSTPGTATVAAGLVKAVAPGTTTISAAQGGVTGTATVIVNNLALNSLTVTPNNPSVALNQTVQLKAVGTFSDNSTSSDWTNLVSWTTSNSANVTVSSAGLVTGKTAGQSATITATIATATGTATGSVTVNVTQ